MKLKELMVSHWCFDRFCRADTSLSQLVPFIKASLLWAVPNSAAELNVTAFASSTRVSRLQGTLYELSALPRYVRITVRKWEPYLPRHPSTHPSTPALHCTLILCNNLIKASESRGSLEEERRHSFTVGHQWTALQNFIGESTRESLIPLLPTSVNNRNVAKVPPSNESLCGITTSVLKHKRKFATK